MCISRIEVWCQIHNNIEIQWRICNADVRSMFLLDFLLKISEMSESKTIEKNFTVELKTWSALLHAFDRGWLTCITSWQCFFFFVFFSVFAFVVLVIANFHRRVNWNVSGSFVPKSSRITDCWRWISLSKTPFIDNIYTKTSSLCAHRVVSLLFRKLTAELR